MSKEVTLTPEFVADMGIKEFIDSCEKNNVTLIKVMMDLSEMAMSSLQQVYAANYTTLMNRYTSKSVVASDVSDVGKLVQVVTTIGAKMGDLQAKRDIASSYLYKKTPDCFKEGKLN